MSRGLGKLQRALLEQLEKRTEPTTAIELAMATQATDPKVGFDEVHSVAVCRALHGLHRRGLVGLAHHGLRYYDSEILARAVYLGAEVLIAWLPSKHKRPHEHWAGGMLNPKRCPNAPHEEQDTRPDRSVELAELEHIIGSGLSVSFRTIVTGTQRLEPEAVQ